MASLDTGWISGEICEIVGRYRTKCCRGIAEANFVVSDIFPRCKHCGKKLTWRRSFAGALPVDTIETPAGNRKARLK